MKTLAKILGKRPRAIIFGSFLHGSGRSFLADKLANALEKEGIKVARISSGQIFRELAKSEGKSIEGFISEITRDKEKAREVDLRIDQEMKRRILEELENGKVVIVDSNLAPFYSQGIKILVRTDPSIAGERVYKGKRSSDKSFSSPEEAREALERRTREDVERYAKLAGDSRVPKEWREIYERAVKEWGNEERFHLVIDNSGPAEESLKNVVEGLIKVLKEGEIEVEGSISLDEVKKRLKRVKASSPDSLEILQKGLNHNYATVRETAIKKLMKHPKGEEVLAKHIERETAPELVIKIAKFLAKKGRIEPIEKKIGELKKEEWVDERLIQKLERIKNKGVKKSRKAGKKWLRWRR